jgi:hypothetical protein
MLGHKQTSTTQRYAHLADDPVRAASNKIAHTIAAAMGEIAEGTVIPFGKRN